ncbi:terminase large subunit [Bacillus sp. FJAT-49705]|uniref:Terminase large subunit n=2 Tax=Cytobacillus citreus TaxID=2833586 RepID=A0ABS5NWI5_9BACI|nr:terminase large subunit [Cytobacillus citreus]
MVQYCHAVINGEVIACQKHIWACMRFLRDVEKEGTEDFPYIFDEEKAMRFFDWMSLFRHTKGVLRGERIEPHEIQVFIFGNIYGWIHKETGYRRFGKAYWQVGRKNAKSQSLAVVGTYEQMAFGENMSEVYIGATKKEQAKIVWNETEAILKACPELKGKYKVAYGEIKHLNSDSIMRALSKEDKKSGDGFNPQCAIIDEYHAHETDEILNVMDSGMIARAQPLIIIITTAGKDLSSPCFRIEYDYVSKLLDPNNPVENDEYYAMVNELDKDENGNLVDNIRDEDAWLKANPIAASYPEGIKNIRKRLKESLEKPEMMDDYLTKNMNVWINQKEKAYMRMDRWADCGSTKENPLPDLRGKTGFMGVDLSSKIDLTSTTFDFPLEDGRHAVLSHSFMPEDTVEEREKKDKIPYRLWAREGWITLTPGSVVDYNFIKAYVIREIEENGWNIGENCYDPYNATQFAQDMEAEGFIPVEIRQGIKTLGEPTKNFRDLVLQKKIIHNNNPVLTWAIGNAVTRQDHNGNIMLDKEKSRQRIDPIAAGINAHTRAMFNIETIDINKTTNEYLNMMGW